MKHPYQTACVVIYFYSPLYIIFLVENMLDIFKARNTLRYFTVSFLCDLQISHLMMVL